MKEDVLAHQMNLDVKEMDSALTHESSVMAVTTVVMDLMSSIVAVLLVNGDV